MRSSISTSFIPIPHITATTGAESNNVNHSSFQEVALAVAMSCSQDAVFWMTSIFALCIADFSSDLFFRTWLNKVAIGDMSACHIDYLII
jgi:hypothetical protein